MSILFGLLVLMTMYFIIHFMFVSIDIVMPLIFIVGILGLAHGIGHAILGN